MQGREGSERYPQASELSLEDAILRALRPLDSTITLPWVQEITALYTEEEVVRARNAMLLARPDNVQAYFVSQFRREIPAKASRIMADCSKSNASNFTSSVN